MDHHPWKKRGKRYFIASGVKTFKTLLTSRLKLHHQSLHSTRWKDLSPDSTISNPFPITTRDAMPQASMSRIFFDRRRILSIAMWSLFPYFQRPINHSLISVYFSKWFHRHKTERNNFLINHKLRFFIFILFKFSVPKKYRKGWETSKYLQLFLICVKMIPHFIVEVLMAEVYCN